MIFMDTLNRIYAMIEDETGYPKHKITLKTRLYQDIKIDGDDAEEFLYKYSEEFKVDMSSFDFNCYFNDELFDSISILKSFFGFGENRVLGEITVEMLENSANCYKWIY